MRKIIFIMCVAIFLISIFSNMSLAASSKDDPELISLDLKGMDIRDVLKILAQKSGLNIVADSSVKGMVTLYIKDVTIMDALDTVISTNNLAYEQSGSLIRIMNDRDYEMMYGKRFNDKTKTEIIKLNYANAQEIASALNQIKTSVGKVISDDVSSTIVLIDSPENIDKMKKLISQMDIPLITEVFPLDYAKAELLKDKISEIISKGAGSVKFDERTNKLVVKDTQQKVEDIRKVIDAFDEKTRQVLIDANIVQVTLSDKFSYGIDWANVAKLGDIKLTGDTVLSTGLSNTTPSTFTIATTGHHATTIISLLKIYGKTNVLSRPRVMVINNQEAKILVGAKEVYVTSEVTTTSGGTYHTTDHVQFVDVGVRLGVIPTINKQGFITLKIKPEVSNADATKTVQLKNPDGSTRTIVPYVTTSEVETSVMIKDNTTIIIGGLMKDTIVNNKEKVPFLGDVPLIGKLFSTIGKSKEKTELVIFLTPHIIEGDKTTDETQRYIADWDKKAEEIKIEEPKEPEIKLSKRAPEKKEKQPKPEKATKKVVAKKKGQPKQKWTPILGSESSEGLEDSAAKSPGTNMTPYEEYYLNIGQEINDLAKQDKDVSGINGEVELKFTLDKEGFLIKGPIVLNQPDLRLVRSAVKIVKKASPFISFPKALNKDQADFNVVVRYE
jgi:MSHA biogenesis protein MshL